MHVGDCRALHLRILNCAHGHLKPLDRLGQAVLQEVLHHLSRHALLLVGGVDRAD